MEDFTYKSDDFERALQRYITPLYVKDELGNYNYSSTATLIFFNNSHYLIFTAHALKDGGGELKSFYIMRRDGEFLAILENAIGYEVYDEDDVVIVEWFNARIEEKNYFDLNKKLTLNGFNKKYFGWIGFPKNKKKIKDLIHNTKTKEKIASEHVIEYDNGHYFTKIKYLTLYSEINSNNDLHISGYYNPEEGVELKYAGKKSTGPSLPGMSGGAMFYCHKTLKLQQDLDKTFQFAGLGIEHKKDNSIVGVSRNRIIKLLMDYEKNHPLDLTLIS
ncbi:hypothetical protein H8I69_23190 [Serratia fonticola]|uniref:hypothetical protein n=1 Tax=Serratia fonticola TaxID=47917 RepID=UPI0015C617BC|nr:hypothetical protein [Serratia fonticola]MBC3382024.1 hypothetical protein [Serratia fonticola]NYA41224.1 hypothetical protein [Serratia fonticola]